MPLLSFQSLRDRLTIRSQVALLTAITCIAAVGIAAAGAAVLARQSAVASANQELQALARNMADRLDQHMFERYREIKNIAGLGPLQETWSSDPDAVRVVLQRLQASLPEYAWLGFASPDGTVRAATKGMLEGASVAARPWFINGLKQPTVEDVHDAKLLDKLLRVSPDDAPFRFVDVAMPVKNRQGALAGVLGAHMSWTWADDVRQTVLANEDATAPADLWVVARDGSVLIGPPSGKVEPARLVEKGGTVFIDTSHGSATLTALVTTRGSGDYPGLGWTVAARKPVNVIYATANRLVIQILLVGFIVAGAASYLAWVLSGAVTKPLQNLAERLDLIGRKANITSVEREHGSLDILQLSAAVRSLLRRVGLAEASQQDANSTIKALQREVEAQKKNADEKMLRFGQDLHTLQILADTDGLTGLLNRRAFLPFAEDAWNYFKRYNREFSILMFDIDHFKKINDTFGHSAGDEVIRTMGQIISAGIRTTDKVARFGGEEFVVLLRETDEAAAVLLANRLREKIAKAVVETGGHTITFTTSVGCALATRLARDLEDVIHAADKALYAAKTSGRNRVELHRSSDNRQAA
ncbi:diguanylate cyclase [Rhizobium sp. XQZ8]|nr:diguanylate cyclase [Rhizobium populisoli]